MPHPFLIKARMLHRSLWRLSEFFAPRQLRCPGPAPVPCPAPLPALERWQPPIGVRPWGLRGWRIGHALDIPQDQLVPCALAVRGPLSMQGPGVIEGDVTTHCAVQLGPGCRLHGQLLCDSDVHLGLGCYVRGPVKVKGRLHLSPGVVIGSPQQPVSVCADAIETEGPVRIHGCVHVRLHSGFTSFPPHDPHTT